MGFVLVEVVASVASLFENGIPDRAFVAPVGVVVGTAQWLVLRHHVSRAAWWILATTVSSVVCNDRLLGGILYGLITGG